MLAAQADAVMAEHYGEKLTLQSLAEQLKVSPFHLQRTYKRVTGQSPAARLDQLRLEKASRLLADTGLAIAEVGKAVSFQGPSHFTAWFARKTGLAPTEYRTEFKGGIQHDPDTQDH